MLFFKLSSALRMWAQLSSSGNNEAQGFVLSVAVLLNHNLED